MQYPSKMVTTTPENAKNRIYADPHPLADDLFIHASFINTYAIKTDEGTLLIDPGLGINTDAVYAAVKGWCPDPIHTAVYTHGHADHVCGLRAFVKAGEKPHIIAQENCVERFHRYQLTHGYNAVINQRQFNLAKPSFVRKFNWPTLTFRDSLHQRLGQLDIHYHAGKGETDDHCYLWIPQRGYLFCGDFIIWNSPNCGNPQKVQRYPREWAENLEKMAALGAEWLLPGHGLVVYGREAVRQVLLETAQYLHHIVDQVLELMNEGVIPEEIFHRVEAHPQLQQRPYLKPLYDHPKFIVRNLLRLWGGWWNGNPAELFPAKWEQQAREIVDLAGGVANVVQRARELMAQQNLTLVSHLAEWATRAEPQSEAAQQLKRDVYEQRIDETPTMMAKGIYRAAMNEARAALGQPAVDPDHRMSLGTEED